MATQGPNARIGQDHVGCCRVKILMVGNFGRGWDGSICDEEHIASALEHLGHEVCRHQRNPDIYPIAVDDYDFTLVAQWDRFDEGILKKLPKPVVYWAFDYQADGQEWHELLKRDCDLYLSKPLRDMSDKWQWLSQDFAPEFLDKVDARKDIDVLFTGSWVPWESGQERVKVLKAIDEQFNLQINSVTPDQWKAEGFKNVHGPVMDEGLPELYARAKINFSMDHVLSAGYWSDRNAQIMACGGFVLFRYVPLSESTFGGNVAYFYNTEDCLEKIAYYLEHEEEREQIAQNGYIHAHRNLMVRHRVKELLTIVKSYL